MFQMVDFKETAKEIFNMCTNIAKSDGRATEKIEAILRKVYENGKDNQIIYSPNTNKSNLSLIQKRLFDEIRHSRTNPQ